MMTDQLAQIMAAASHAAYDSNNNSIDTNDYIKLLDNGYTRLDGVNLNDPNTGFSATVFKKEGTEEYIVF